MKILRKQDPAICFGKETIFADHAAANRSGHLGHAMVECADGSLLAFYMNTSGAHNSGHTMYGWVEYRRSHDRGVTWSEPTVLKYSWDCFIEGVCKIGCEKAVVCDDGTIVLFCLRSIGKDFEPYATPVCLLSHDGGGTWSEPIEVHSERGRIYDALYKDGVIYVMHCCGDYFLHQLEEDQHYRLYTSTDNGQTFEEVSIIPFPQQRRSYGNMIFDAEGRLHAYAYNDIKERELDHAVSEDNGKTWTLLEPCYLDKAIRNPQVGYVDGVYVMHGRSEGLIGFVFYTSEDATHWSEGTYLNTWDHPIGQYYSNNITLEDEQGKFLLVQYSESYDGSGRVNIKHTRLRVKKKN